jgi:hypothetical protein
MTNTLLFARRTLAALLAAFLISTSGLAAQRQRGSVLGNVVDEAGAAVDAAKVTLVDAAGTERSTATSRDGRFAFADLAAGTYSIRVDADGFAEHTAGDIVVTPPSAERLSIQLSVAAVAESVTVAPDTNLAADSSSNADALVIKGRDLEALPDDPDELANALQELAGPGAAPGGGQIFIDGFTGGRLPPKEAIREIRINSNPFSAEYDRLGFGRIEILTKPGSDKFRGTVTMSFNDESLNARDPFALVRAPEQDRRYGGNVSGPLGKRASFFLDVERRDQDDSDTVSALVLDPSGIAVPFTQSVQAPQRRTTFSPRFDYQLTPNNTLVVRYGFTDSNSRFDGVGEYSLPSAAFDSFSREHVLNFTDTQVMGTLGISETRLQLVRRRTRSEGLSTDTVINVADAFVENSSVGLRRRGEDRLELQQNFSFAFGSHAVKTGVRLRGSRLLDYSTSNFAGTYFFSGDAERDPVTGEPLEPNVIVSSIDQYARVLAGTPFYSPSQFTLSAGEPFASTNQFDVGAFVQDDWRVKPNLSLSYGLRYEAQTHVESRLSFAPRAGFAYSIDGPDGRPVMVFRGGLGIFFDRIDEGLSLDEVRFDGTRQQQFVVFRPTFFPNVPSPAELESFAIAPTIRELNADRTPYTIQGSLGVERQFGWGLMGSVVWVWSRGLHQLRLRNLNVADPVTGERPYGDTIGNLYSYEPSGSSRRRQLRFSLNKRSSGSFSLFMNYTLGWAKSDTDGSFFAPSNPFDFSADWGRASDDVRHQFVVGGSWSAPFGLQVSPFVIARSSRPFNITIGGDLNRDSFFNDRPSYATSGEEDGVATPIGLLDPSPEPGDTIIPRNAGEGFGFVRVNLSVSRTFGFGARKSGRFDPSAGGGGGGGGFGGISGQGGRGGGGRGGGGRGPGGFGEASGNDRRYGLTLTVRMQNLLNHPAFGNPSGVLTSPNFGLPNTAFGARQIEGQVRFSF